jgi:hypothetical protein
VTPLASTLPHSNDGYVAAAYIVFFAIVLIYVAIMAVRLGRVERKVEQLRVDARGDIAGAEPGADARAGGARPSDAGAHPEDTQRERETV